MFWFSMPALAERGAHWAGPELVGMTTEEALDEISGFTASTRHPGVYWVHNDGGNQAELYAINEKGQRKATLRIKGVKNLDWEDLSHFEQDGRHYLLIGDTGDNGGIRAELNLIAIEEPAELRRRQEVEPAWTQRFRWPDGPRDCEAMTVDAHRGEVLLVSKKRVPPELFRLPLRPSDSLVTAEAVGVLAGIAQPSEQDLAANPVYGRYRAQVTGLDLSPNGRVLAVLNYSNLYFYRRPPGSDWSTHLQQVPGRIRLPWLPQAEAVGFARDGRSLLITSEQIPSPILRYRVEH